MARTSTKKTAIFRCDASALIGAGHVMRCMVLAGALQKQGIQCVFSTIPETLAVVPSLPSRYDVVSPEEIENLRPDILVIDHYGMDLEHEMKIAGLAGKTVVVDDLCDRQHFCDALVSNTLVFSEGDYKSYVPDVCRVFADPGYLLIRPEFQVAEADIRERLIPVKRLLLFFGMTDPANLTLRVLGGLERAGAEGLHVDVVIGQGHPHKQEIVSACQKIGAQLHIQIDYMKRLMMDADLAVGCGGTAIWERLAVGLPALEITHSDWQVFTLSKLDRLGYLKYIGHAPDIDDIGLAETLKDALKRGIGVRRVRCGHRIDELAQTLAGME